MPGNELYLTVLPLVHIGSVPYVGFGQGEQTLTLFPDKSFATEFFPDEVDSYIATFKASAEKYLKGGHVTGYDIQKETTDDGRVIVKVTQNVS